MDLLILTLTKVLLCSSLITCMYKLGLVVFGPGVEALNLWVVLIVLDKDPLHQESGERLLVGLEEFHPVVHQALLVTSSHSSIESSSTMLTLQTVAELRKIARE